MDSIQQLPARSAAMPTLETELLIVGAGPAGASLACFLARYGLRGIAISAAPGTADTPRAHINNMAAMETLRDIGLWDECNKLGNSGNSIMHYRWCESMNGAEYARNFSWGAGPRRGDYDTVSPCHHMDLPQNLLEPILVKYATTHGFKVRFDTRLTSFTEDEKSGKIICTVEDRATQTTYNIATRYLFGADGGRSTIVEQLKLPMTIHPGGGLAFNVLVRTDLSHLMAHRQGNLHWCIRLNRDYPLMCVSRMVKPWYEWMFVFFPKGPDVEPPNYTADEWKDVVKDFIDDDTVDVEILRVSKWVINEMSADVISKGNIFCLGDAIHRHPPTLGLGSNTCIQDAFNLAWKIHLVMKGAADPSILHTYNIERQPIGAHLVKASNDVLRKHILVWQAMGVQPYGASQEERSAMVKILKSNTAEGRDARKLLKDRVDGMNIETESLGMEFGQYYSSAAVDASDEPEPFRRRGREAQDSTLYYEPNTYPGRRLPHVWLNTVIPGNLISTVDVAGKGRFCLFTGVGGDGWKKAAKNVGRELGVDIKAVGIGRGQDWEEVYLDWTDKRGVEDDGAVLVRPDLFVGWRAQTSGDEESRLRKAMKNILGHGKKEQREL
ncbi:2,4-dichlorophenol 6-monooxygenase [Polyplosphaeria fusca]|uniref:2,4-dichlorophenol 6-monooxygenase n=1 Tax=Polyplosphaeria fusca TaxID=682080 RepID=A0A9P4QL35_9PLEO|nr:2,4-dichlorophenol 6-monooxygenase [Polyplosphaeria fusca]